MGVNTSWIRQLQHTIVGLDTAPLIYYILMEVKQLDMIEQIRLLEAIAQLVQRETASKSSRSIHEIRGLGKGVWNNLNAQAYVNQERDSWA